MAKTGTPTGVQLSGRMFTWHVRGPGTQSNRKQGPERPQMPCLWNVNGRDFAIFFFFFLPFKQKPSTSARGLHGTIISSFWGAPVSSEWAFYHQLRYPRQQQPGALSEGQPWALHHARHFPGEILVRRMLPDLETQKLRYHLGPLTQVSKMPLSFSPELPLFLILSQWEKRKASKHLLPCCVVPENIGGVKHRHRAGSADSDIIKTKVGSNIYVSGTLP